MTGPSNMNYQWVDDKSKKNKCSAPQYVEYVMTSIQRTITDETLFPTKYGQPFPQTFDNIIRKLFRLLFHVIAHIYAAHFQHVAQFGMHTHLNTLFLHLMSFDKFFKMVDDKETDILTELYIKLQGERRSSSNEDHQSQSPNNCQSFQEDAKNSDVSKMPKSTADSPDTNTVAVQSQSMCQNQS